MNQWSLFLQALLQKETEKSSLSERLMQIQRELSDTRLEAERFRRETQVKQDQDKVSVYYEA